MSNIKDRTFEKPEDSDMEDVKINNIYLEAFIHWIALQMV